MVSQGIMTFLQNVILFHKMNVEYKHIFIKNTLYVKLGTMENFLNILR